METSKQIELFEKELTFKRYRQTSIKNYVSCVKVFLEYFKQKDSCKHINEQEIKSFLMQFSGHNTQRSYHSAIKTFYKYVVKQPNKFKYLEYARKQKTLPIVHSVDEIQSLLNACDNLKHKCCISLIYACGLRVSEAINLKLDDIDSKRMIINIKNAKGGVDRQVMLPEKLLLLMRKYYLEYKPKVYLFNGQFDLKYSSRSIAQFLNKYSDKANLTKRIYPHLLRHDCFTHLVEAGTDINIIKGLAGHKNTNTSLIYVHISDKFISKINSPINTIQL